MKKVWLKGVGFVSLIILLSLCLLYYWSHHKNQWTVTTPTKHNSITPSTSLRPVFRIPIASQPSPSSPTSPPSSHTEPHDITDTTDDTSPSNEDQDDLLSMFKEGFIYDKFTIVMPTYKRTENLFRIMDQYCGFGDIIDRIMILWNNIGREIPKDLASRADRCEIPVVIRVMEKNNLTSRFYPYSQIKTAGVMSLDDDNIIDKPSLELAFRAFQKYPYRIVGYDARGFSVGDHNNYRYSFKSHPYTVILTNRAIVHHRYLELFSSIPSKIRDFVIEHKNGEDLAMNMVIGKYLKDLGKQQCVGVKVKTKTKALNNYSKEKYGGLSRRSSHINDRHKCFQLLADVYGDLHDYLPECTTVINSMQDI